MLGLNFKIDICQEKEYYVDFLGWKHSIPKNPDVYDVVEEINNLNLIFFFCLRNFDSWKMSMNRFFKGAKFEFKNQENIENRFIFYTPEGPEVYENIKNLYDCKNEKYLQFYMRNEQKCFLVDFDYLQNNQKLVLQNIKDKFNLETINEDFIEIKKRININGFFDRDINISYEN
jgi:hypothetical protein